MKVIHLADLHLGKTFHKKSLICDQSWMLEQVVNLMRSARAHLVIAGDVFDSANPSIEAQELFVGFMNYTKAVCEDLGLTCIIIVGNHDSSRRLGLWERFMGTNVHIVRDTEDIEIEGIPFRAISFVKPTIAETKFNREFDSYNEAFKAYLPENTGTILIAHQTFGGCITGSSESMSFFDDAVSQEVVKAYPLVMAGHIHRKQRIRNIYYPGSLMPYAFGDEYAGGFTVWDIKLSNHFSWEYDITSEVVPIQLRRNFEIIRGSLKHCLSIPDSHAYIKVELVDEDVPLDVALPQLQAHFENMVTAVSKITDDWEADLNKPMVQFDSIESALDSFCNQLEVPVLDTKKLQLVQEVVHEITETAD